MHHRYMYFKLSKFLENISLHTYMHQYKVPFKALLTWTDILSLLEKLKYWKLDIKEWLIVCFFTSRSRVIHSYRETPFPIKGRSKFNINHLLIRYQLFQTLKVSSKGVLRFKASAPTVWVAIITWSDDFLKLYQRLNPNNVTLCYVCPAESLRFICGSSQVRISTLGIL